MAILIALFLLVIASTHPVVTWDTAVSVSVKAFLELLQITDEACDTIQWCSLIRGGHQQDGRGVPFMERWYSGCSCDDSCLVHATCCPDYTLSRAMPGNIFSNASVLATAVLGNRTLSGMDMTVQYDTDNNGTHAVISPSASVETSNATVECVPSGLLKLDTLPHVYISLPSYRMITSCSRFNVSDMLKHSCEGRKPTTIEDYLPVQSLVTGNVYRNKYCLLCSNEAQSLNKSWSVFVSRDNVPEQLINDYILSYDYFVQKLLNRSLCDLVFAPDEELSKRFTPPVCFNVDVDTCADGNNTDSSLLSLACRSYVAPVYTGYAHDHYIFKNMACFRCNDVVSALKKDNCPFLVRELTFAGTLRRPLVQNEQMTDTRALGTYTSPRCGEGRIYDDTKNICKDVYCTCGFVAENASCVPVFQTVSGGMFEMNVIITARQRIDTQDIMHTYEECLIRYLRLVFGVDSDYILESLVLYRDVYRPDSVEHAACITFSYRETFAPFLDLLVYLAKTVQGLITIGQNNVTFAAMLTISDSLTCSRENVVDVSKMKVYNPTQFQHLTGSDRVDSGQTIRILECHFCYRVEISKDEIEKNGRLIRIKETGIIVTPKSQSNIMFSPRVLVCIHKALAKVDGLSPSDDNHGGVMPGSNEWDNRVKENGSNKGLEKELSLVCILAILVLCVGTACVVKYKKANTTLYDNTEEHPNQIQMKDLNVTQLTM